MAFYLTVQSRHSLVSDIVKNQSSYISWHHRRRVRATISPDFHDRSIGDMTLYETPRFMTPRVSIYDLLSATEYLGPINSTKLPISRSNRRYNCSWKDAIVTVIVMALQTSINPFPEATFYACKPATISQRLFASANKNIITVQPLSRGFANIVKWFFLMAKIFPPYYPACDPITNKSVLTNWWTRNRRTIRDVKISS